MIFYTLVIGLLVIAILFLLSYKSNDRKLGEKVKTLIVLGSGGHTAEMLSLMHTLDLSQYHPRIYVSANTDVGVNSSIEKAKKFEKDHNQNESNYVTYTIPRSREVGQSWISTIWTTLNALRASFVLIWQVKPDLVRELLFPN